MRRIICLALAITLVATVSMADLTYNGSSTIGQNILPEATKVFTQKSGIKFAGIKNDGSGKGIKAILAGQCDVAGISRAPKDSEKKEDLRFYTIGFDAISVIVHKDNPVKTLTKEQVAGIFGGKIRNWKEVGGKDAPIVPVTEILGEKRATQVVFTEIVLGTDDLTTAYGDNIVQVDQPVDEANAVAKDANAISAVSAAFVTDAHHALTVDSVSPTTENVVNGTYPISRPLNLVTPKKASKEVMEFVKFMLTPDAQGIVGQSFVRAK